MANGAIVLNSITALFSDFENGILFSLHFIVAKSELVLLSCDGFYITKG